MLNADKEFTLQFRDMSEPYQLTLLTYSVNQSLNKMYQKTTEGINRIEANTNKETKYICLFCGSSFDRIVYYLFTNGFT